MQLPKTWEMSMRDFKKVAIYWHYMLKTEGNEVFFFLMPCSSCNDNLSKYRAPKLHTHSHYIVSIVWQFIKIVKLLLWNNDLNNDKSFPKEKKG